MPHFHVQCQMVLPPKSWNNSAGTKKILDSSVKLPSHPCEISCIMNSSKDLEMLGTINHTEDDSLQSECLIKQQFLEHC